MHYKTKSERHENIIKARVTDSQLLAFYIYANEHDLPLAVALRELATTNPRFKDIAIREVSKGAGSYRN